MGKVVIMAEFPEIIKELVNKAKSDELRHFDLSSFMSDKSLEDVFKKIVRVQRLVFSHCVSAKQAAVTR